MAADAPLRIAVAGASGRMGRMLVEAVLASDDCTLAGALDVAASRAGRRRTLRFRRASGVRSSICAGLASRRC
jgi:4-hydroxy-tetrahydrodipicolinate reductase